MAVHITTHRSGFGPGITEVTRIGEDEHDTGIALSVLRLGPEERFTQRAESETAYLLVSGRATLTVRGGEGGGVAQVSRRSLFDEGPWCAHVARGAEVAIVPDGTVELLLHQTANERPFPARIYPPELVRDEPRGRGLVRDAAFRVVRTIFDRTTAPDAAELVLGEVVTLPGRWSSYPPHHHPQPEIYHYRFTSPDGWGHAELGETVLKVRPYDTVKILDGLDHPQCAAPGYGMYYSWAIRHLPGRPYGVPEFAPEHRWTLEPGARFWWPSGQGEREDAGE